MRTNCEGITVDSNTLLRRAEHEISYRAKRTIEMFLPAWEKDASLVMFDKCAEAHILSLGEKEKCRALMSEMGMDA